MAVASSIVRETQTSNDVSPVRGLSILERCHPVYNEVGIVKTHCGGDARGALFLTFLIPQGLGF
jgi:hypothetical protein